MARRFAPFFPILVFIVVTLAAPLQALEAQSRRFLLAGSVDVAALVPPPPAVGSPAFNEQMAELGNNLRDSGIEVRQMSREEMEKMQETIRQSLKGLDAYAIAE